MTIDLNRPGKTVATEIRRMLREHPNCVFAQEREGGSWVMIVAVRTVGGIVWVTPEIGCGSFMPAAVRLTK